MRSQAATILLAAMVAGVVRGAEPGEQPEIVVPVFVDNGDENAVDIVRAELLADEMFRTANVKIDWLSSRSSRPGADVMVVSFVAAHRSQFSQGALGAALQGTHIEVVYDRVKAAPLSMRPTLLAHVLVHEITHILQGISRHSQEGVMKANWTDADYRAMLRKPLPFTPEDIALIHMSQVKRAHNGRFAGKVSG